jgi:hypothetical protein
MVDVTRASPRTRLGYRLGSSLGPQTRTFERRRSGRLARRQQSLALATARAKASCHLRCVSAPVTESVHDGVSPIKPERAWRQSGPRC